MVQTRPGAASSEWLNFIKECSVQYHARKKAAISAEKACKTMPKDGQDKQAKEGKLCDCATAVRVKTKRGALLGLPVEKKT